MKPVNRSVLTGTLITIAVLSAVVFVRTLVQAAFYSAPDEVTVESATSSSAMLATSTPQRIPLRLKIPALEVNAKVQKVGIAYSGAMAVPTNFTDVGWYKKGVEPGNVGIAFIDGHVDNALGLDGVFKHLDTLKEGDDIYIITESGETLHFTVITISVYEYDAPETKTIFDNPKDGESYIRLITCGGTWIQDKKSYDKRIVVTAQKN